MWEKKMQKMTSTQTPISLEPRNFKENPLAAVIYIHTTNFVPSFM